MKINGVTFITATRYDVLKKFAEVSLTFFSYEDITSIFPTAQEWLEAPVVKDRKAHCIQYRIIVRGNKISSE